MADTELGVQVTVTGAEQGKAQLDQFAASSRGAAAGVNDLAAAQAKASTGAASGGALAASARATTTATKEVGQAATASAQDMTLWQRVVNAFSWGGFNSGATTAQTAMAGVSISSHEARVAIHTAELAAYEAGTQFGGLGRFALLARSGITVLAAAVGVALVVAIQNAVDQIGVMQRTFQALYGSKGGEDFFKRTKAAAEELGTTLSQIAPALTSIQNAYQRDTTFRSIQKDATGTWEAFKGMQTETKKWDDAVETVHRSMDLVFGVTQKTSDETNKFFANISKWSKDAAQSQKLTVDEFLRLKDEAPPIANLLERAFGPTLWDRLKKGPIDYKEVVDKISLLKPALFLQPVPQTVTSSFDQLKNSVNDLMAAMGKPETQSGIGNFLKGITGYMKDLSKEMDKGKGFWSSFFTVEWEKIKATWRQNVKELQDIISGKESVVSASWLTKEGPGQMSAGGKELWDPLVKAAQQAWPQIEAAVQNGWTRVKEILSETGIGSAILEMWASLRERTQTAWQDVRQTVSDYWNQIDQIMSSSPFGDVWGQLKQSASDAWSQIKQMVSDTWAQIKQIASGDFSGFWDGLKQSASGVWATIVDGATTAVTGFGAAVSSIVASVTNAINSMVQAAVSAWSALKSAVGSLVGGGGGGGASSPSFTLPGDFGAGFATGGAFQVSGSGGVDSVPVRFMATPGEIVTITPNNLTSPGSIAGLTSASLTQQQAGAVPVALGEGAAPVRAFTGPITFAVKDSTGQIVGAVDSATAAIDAMAKTVASAVASGGASVASGGSGGLHYTYSGKAGSAAGPLGSGPIDAYGNIVPSTQATYVARINYNSAIAGMPMGQAQQVYAVNPNYTGAATGGTFMAQGPTNATDALSVGMRLTAGELVKVTPPDEVGARSQDPRASSSWANKIADAMAEYGRAFGQEIAGLAQQQQQKRIGKDRPIQIYISGGQMSPGAMLASAAQIKRQMRQALA